MISSFFFQVHLLALHVWSYQPKISFDDRSWVRNFCFGYRSAGCLEETRPSLTAMNFTWFLRTFSNWVGKDYNTQMYTGGTKCWNGPDRSVKLIMTCGTVNEIVSVNEPEKCEYVFKMQTPAVCAVLDDVVSDVGEDSSVPPKHDEL